jgi:hypothetical protein
MFTNISGGVGESWVFGDMAVVYITGWVKASDAATALAEADDYTEVISIASEAGEYTMRLRILNDAGTRKWCVYYYNNGAVVSADKLAQVDGTTYYFKMFYDDTNNDIFVSIGVDPENQTTLINDTNIATNRNSGVIYIGSKAPNGLTNGALDLEFDSIAIDNAAYDRTEYK